MSKEKHLIARVQLGLFITQRREEMGHSCKALADFIGISENTMQRIEEGNLDFELSLLFRICEAIAILPFFVPLEDQFIQEEIKFAVFEDAHALSVLHSKSFELPTNEQLSKLKIGDLVKVNSYGERFWSKIAFIDFKNKTVIAVIDNDLSLSDEHGLKLGDAIKFNFQNIYSIYED